MTTYLILQAALWGVVTFVLAVFTFTEPGNESGPFAYRPSVPHNWPAMLLWLGGCAAMTLWPLWLIYAR